MSQATRTGNVERIVMREAHRIGYGVHGVEEVGDEPSLRFLQGNLQEFGTALRFYIEIMGAPPSASDIDRKWPRNDGLKASQFFAAANSAYDAFKATNGKSAKRVIAAWRRILPKPKPKPADGASHTVLALGNRKPKASPLERML